MDVAKDFPLEEALQLLCEYAWLAEFRIVDFITANYWSLCDKIPEPWRIFAESTPDDDYADGFIDLLSLKSAVPSCPVEKFARDCYKCSFLHHSPQKAYSDPDKRRNVKQKKSYEVEVLSSTLCELMKRENLNLAVDVGAGQGYLAMELLKMNEDYTIVAVECSDIQVHGTITRLQDAGDAKARLHLRQVYLSADKSGDEIDKMMCPDSVHGDYLMYSLHACGSLSESMVQIFCNCSASVLFNVACCYNLIDETLAGQHFPMSKRVSSNISIPLTRNMKMVACQAPSRWGLRPQKTKNFLRRHFYRALLELAVKKFVGDCMVETKVGNIPDSALESFSQYATCGFNNLNIPPPDASELDLLYESHRHLEKLLAFMWSMRALLGPVVEATILCDRYHYIKELLPSAKVSLQAVLDPSHSPRNMALIAIKSVSPTLS
ncbi:hypothetical protein PSACC_01467 [Paramicrosporidium saccamoebae]|uniref:Methyltransferase domain-containing protein n=1 Tax=Paramicrosporidium saccamoebae TaxID=1246581 RepID=A0A2H9TM42_9FUNG|nr:hypothetical protein PSACC_01467 [Paramicrosporidium saccamoebae]